MPETDKVNAERVAQLMTKADLKTSSYGTYYRLGSFEEFAPYLEVAKILGATILRVWAGEKGSAETTFEGRQQIVADAQRIGELAAAEGLSISLEYHANTLTDTPESAARLMEEIDSEEVLFYWQPANDLTVKERLDSLPQLAQWITNVHVFHWENFRNRFPLAEGFDDWKQYMEII